MNDLKFAIRQLLKAPGFTAAAVLTLALGIGANTAMFSVVDGVLLRSLPYDDPGQLVQVFEAGRPGARNSVSVGVYSDWARHTSAFEDIAAVFDADMNLTGTGEPERLSGLRMTAAGLRVLRARPVLGRTFAPDEDQAGKHTVIVLTHELWQRRFGGDSGVVGRQVRLNSESYTVIGVLPRAFLPWDKKDFVVPFVFQPEQLEQRGNHWLRVLGRLKQGQTPELARENLVAVSQAYRSLYPVWKKDWGATVVPMQEQLTGDFKPILLTLLGAVALVLLIACANVANLLLARAAAREKEIAIRLAIGASRGRVIRQLLVESLLLAVAGATLGLVLATAATAAVRNTSPANMPRAEQIAVDFRVLGFAVAVSLATGFLFGIVPALQASRLDLNRSLQDAGRGSSGTRNRTRSVLIVSEVALALVLLTGSGLLINSFVRLLDVPMGFEPKHAFVLQASLPGQKYPDPLTRAQVTERWLEQIRALPGVEAAGVANTLPLTWPFDTLITIPGRRGPDDGAYSCDFDIVSPGAFQALGVPLTRGRLFDERDNDKSSPAVIVNETFVRTHFPTEEPLGQTMAEGTGAGNARFEIVGVVGDVRMRGLADRVRPMMYRPMASSGFTNRTVVVRTSGAPELLIEPVRKAIQSVDAEQPVANVRTLEAVVSASVARRRLVLVVLGFFAGAAMLLAAIGLYGVIAYSVSQRTREIGIRVAVGASRGDVLGLFVRQGLRLAGFGVVIGLGAGLGATRLLRSQLYGVGASDPATLLSASALLLAVALLACLVPARRAARVDPMNALR